MNSIDFETLIVIIFVLVDDWYQLGGLNALSLLIDTKPIPVMGYRRSKKQSDFEGSADYGYCAARKMNARQAASQAAYAIALLKYFGYKLVMLSTLEGLPIAYELVPANTDERQAVEGVLQLARGCDIYGDKGFIGEDWQEEITQLTGNKIWTIHRCNQDQQHSSTLKRLIGRVRQRIEGVFHEIQNTGRNPERLLNKTIEGFTTHIAAKITSHTLRLLLRSQFGIDVLTFQSISN